MGWGGKGHEDAPCPAGKGPAHLKAACRGEAVMASSVRLGLGLRVGASCHHCSGLQGLPKPSSSPSGPPLDMRVQTLA